jgi:threonine/homoserine/homoserine lactone efflux protein
MATEQLLSLTGFVMAMVGTPGPNNLMLISAGANFGFRRSLPHIFGIAFGCQILLLAVALGLGQLLSIYPQAMLLLQLAGALFLLYLAWGLLRARSFNGQQQGSAQPMTFLQAALFQWVNPKAWMMTITAIATYSDPAAFPWTVTVISLAFVLLGLPLISIWNLFGTSLRHWLRQEKYLLWFNRGMALLLVGSLYPVLAAG